MAGGRGAPELLLLSVHVLAYLGVVLWVLSPVLAVAFVAVHQAVFGLYMGCSFAPNHKGMPIIGAEQKLDYLRRQVVTSRNVRGGWFVDQLLGGLNYQVEHHLFPSMLRTHLRKAQRLVQTWPRAAPDPIYRDRLVRLLRLRAALSAHTRRTAASGDTSPRARRD